MTDSSENFWSTLTWAIRQIPAELRSDGRWHVTIAHMQRTGLVIEGVGATEADAYVDALAKGVRMVVGTPSAIAPG